MIYLTFDSNIWIYLLDESWKEDNPLDYLEHWIEEKHIQILLPQMILDEWGNHKEKEKRERKKKLREFFSMAEEILPSSFFEDYKKPDEQDKIIELQFNRIENLLNTNAQIIELSQEVKNKAIDRSIRKHAPMHKNKNSVADTLIILSLYEFVVNNQNDDYLFLSENIDDFFEVDNKKNLKEKELMELWTVTKSDPKGNMVSMDSALKNFFERSYKIHTDLKNDFSEFKLTEFSNLNHLIAYLKNMLPVTIDLNIVRKERIKNRVKEQTFNPEHEKLVEDLPPSSFIENINHLKLILNKSVPTKEEAKFAIALIDLDPNYREYFFKKVESAPWFKILKDKGVFNPANNPSPIQVKEGFHFPFWEPLSFLEKLSNQIKVGKELQLVDEIIAIVIAVSKVPNHNYRTWDALIRIVANLPNEKITFEILNFIPIWLEGNFDTMFQSFALCDNLLPKFLPEVPTKRDIKKAELILKYLFAIEKVKVVKKDSLGFEGESYRSRIYMHSLLDAIIEKELVIRISKYCSNDIVVLLANNLKKLRFDFPKGINATIKSSENEFSIKVVIKDKNLLVAINEKGNPDSAVRKTTILDFEKFNEKQTKVKLVAAFKKLKINYIVADENEFNLRIIVNALFNGSYVSFSDNSISKLSDRLENGEGVQEVFALIFRDLLNEKIRQSLEAGIQLLEIFAFDNFYRLSFYKRVVFYVIGENWEVTKSLFLKLIKQKGQLHFFSNYVYYKEIYEVLNKIQMYLTGREIELLNEIIKLGPQDKDEDEGSSDRGEHWKLRWYSALRDVEQFKNKYEILSGAQKLTSDYFEDSDSGLTGRSSTPSFSFDDLFQSSGEDLVNYIYSFKPKSRWEGATIDNLSEALGKAVATEPQKFSDELKPYIGIYYIYAYRILNGFRDAWKDKRTFNWTNVLDFCKGYISDEKFYSGQLSLNDDGWRASSDWVVGSICELLSEGMKSDKNAFDLELLPKSKEIILLMVGNLKLAEDFKQNKTDYPTYSLNSTAGKALRTLLDYSLRRARNLGSDDSSIKWELDVIASFESTLKKGMIDGYILTGWYYQQFYFLNNDWLIKQVKANLTLADEEWLAFMGGVAFANPPFNADMYNLFYPHYVRVIDSNIEIKSINDSGIIRHIVSFYFWGYEDLSNGGLLLRLLKKGNTGLILDLVNFVWGQKKYLNTLESPEAAKFERIILNLWTYLASKYENTEVEEEQKVLSGLSNFLVFIPQLNENYTALVIKSSMLSDKFFHTHFILENLIRLKTKGDCLETAKYVGQIISSLPFKTHASTISNKYIIELVTFLYENGQKFIADKFCNKISRQGHEFLIELHNKFKE